MRAHNTAKFVGFAALALALSAAATSLANKPTRAASEVFESVASEPSQYTAVLHQRTQRWRIAPLYGQEMDITRPARDCAPGAALPTGIWLLTRDDNGAIELLAPSTTLLPVGHSGHVRLRDCAQVSNGEPTLVVPQALQDWLATTTGAIYIDD